MVKNMKKILVILGNPKKTSFGRNLAEAYVKGAKAGDFDVRFLDVTAMKFDPILHEGKDSGQKIEESVLSARKDIYWANHLVFIYPIWWGSMPAIMKGFIERVFSNGFAYKYVKGEAFHRRLLKGKSARLIITMDASYLLYKLLLREHGVKSIKINVFFFCGIGPVKTSNIYNVRKSGRESREKWLDRIHGFGVKGL
ncbi:MAG: NAD(P)H-dependent oxidoreductase [Nanoarchaeota archaeon]|nr:NAD(P)H-dependent oxidoreductase [Nanoarchaeota archaeon]